jgi:hypothetical protein
LIRFFPEPPHHKESENPADNSGDDNANPLPLSRGHRHFSLPDSSLASRFTAYDWLGIIAIIIFVVCAGGSGSRLSGD